MRAILQFWALAMVLRCTQPSGPPDGVSAHASITVNLDSLRNDSLDHLIFWEKIHVTKRHKSLNDNILSIITSFIGTPYGFGILDGHTQEHLVVNLRQLDCWTSIECSLVIALTAADSTPNYVQFRKRLQQFRYHQGVIDGYGSRLHYFSDWILQNATEGHFRDITDSLGGIPYHKKVSYITDIPWYYPQIEDPKTFAQIKASQDRINLHSWYYIPKEKIAGMESKIRSGDIVLLCSERPNMDFEHHGFAIRQKGRAYLLHASNASGKIRVASKPLAEYLKVNSMMSGIMILRID